jgi:steroid delta-isomerase-like uncharacterized protein
MSTDDKKAIIRRFTEEAWNHGSMQVFEEMFAPNFVYHDPVILSVTTLAEYRQFILGVRKMAPNMVYTIDDMIAEGDKVVVRYTWQGTPEEELYGVPPKGIVVTHLGTGFYRFTGTKIIELWDIWDKLGVLQQIGAVSLV